MQITITTNHPSSSYGLPVCLLDGQPANDAAGLRVCMRQLGLTRVTTAEVTGKSVKAIDAYRSGKLPVPAEVWNVLRDRIDGR